MPSNDLPADLPRLPPRKPQSHKFEYGRVVVVGGSAGMAGAPALAAMAALRSGAGLVELLVPDSILSISAGFDPCVMTLGLPSDDGGFAPQAAAAILERSARADVVACGPGLGTREASAEIARRLWRSLERPAVFDADALGAIAVDAAGALREHAGPRIITPHAGEFRRLLHLDANPSRERLEDLASQFAMEADVVVILKGFGSLVTAAGSGWHNTTGNPGMATAGAGDVLTGVVAALVAQKLPPFDAARLATWVHGRAGDVAASKLGQVSLTAVDILQALPDAFCEIAPPQAINGLRAQPSA